MNSINKLAIAIAAAITIASAVIDAFITAACMSSPVITFSMATPAGIDTETLAQIKVTFAPRSRAAIANATPCLPLELFPKKRTGSKNSRVPPAVITMSWPKRSCSLSYIFIYSC